MRHGSRDSRASVFGSIAQLQITRGVPVTRRCRVDDGATCLPKSGVVHQRPVHQRPVLLDHIDRAGIHRVRQHDQGRGRGDAQREAVRGGQRVDPSQLIDAAAAEHFRSVRPEPGAFGQSSVRSGRDVHEPAVEAIRVLDLDRDGGVRPLPALPVSRGNAGLALARDRWFAWYAVRRHHLSRAASAPGRQAGRFAHGDAGATSHSGAGSGRGEDAAGWGRFRLGSGQRSVFTLFPFPS